jgi:hypothetical protein
MANSLGQWMVAKADPHFLAGHSPSIICIWASQGAQSRNIRSSIGLRNTNRRAPASIDQTG